jgi:hypothetical protein
MIAGLKYLGMVVTKALSIIIVSVLDDWLTAFFFDPMLQFHPHFSFSSFLWRMERISPLRKSLVAKSPRSSNPKRVTGSWVKENHQDLVFLFLHRYQVLLSKMHSDIPYLLNVPV